MGRTLQFSTTAAASSMTAGWMSRFSKSRAISALAPSVPLAFSCCFAGRAATRTKRRCNQDRRHCSDATQRPSLALQLASKNSNPNSSRFASSGLSTESVRHAKYNELMAASTLQLAPMMDYTDLHFRHLVRLISRRTLLYTEMVAANAIVHERDDNMQRYRDENPTASSQQVRDNYSTNYLKRFVGQSTVEPLEGPSVLQLGGSDPEQLHSAVQTIMELSDRGICNYTAINLNCGCPSPKVAGKGCFGAALMEDAALVRDLTSAMQDGSQGALPINVKCRIGTDTILPNWRTSDNEQAEYEHLCRFIETVASNGIVTDFGIHARIAVLQRSFSPAANRKIPPLKYHLVRRLVQDYPDLTFTLNGGIESIPQTLSELQACPGLKGVMIGRAWAADPWSFAMADQLLYGEAENAALNRLQVLQAYGRHADYEEAMNDPVRVRRFICKAIMPLFTGEPNSKRYRIALDEIAALPKALAARGKSTDEIREQSPPLSELILQAAMDHLSEETLLRTPQESYERLLFEEEQRLLRSTRVSSVSTSTDCKASLTPERSRSVVEWQSQRQEERERESSLVSSMNEQQSTEFNRTVDLNSTITV